MNDGGWSFSGEKGWILDPSERERVRELNAAVLAEIDVRQSRLPQCALCGQRALRLDKYGLCSKTSDIHQDERKRLAHHPTVGFRS